MPSDRPARTTPDPRPAPAATVKPPSETPDPAIATSLASVNSRGSTSGTRRALTSATEEYRRVYDELVAADPINKERLPSPYKPGLNFDPAEVLDSIKRMGIGAPAKPDLKTTPKADLEA